MQVVHNIAEICAQHGITDVVLSPGSRSAPLTLAFARHPALTVRVVPDERAAAFIALGMAQAQRRAVVLVCTSGTAGLNYAPAVAEAYFQHIPLVIFTADRPPEWIDQLDGQTIRQHNLYGAHAKGAFEFPADTTHTDAKWHSARIVNEAINLAQAGPAGPVQVNVPLREPFYPKAGEAIQYEQNVKIVRELPASASTTLPANWAELREVILASDRTLVVLGQQTADPALLQGLMEFLGTKYATVVADCLGQINAFDPVTAQDVFLPHIEPHLLQPDVLITCGLSLISKSLKLFLRKNPPNRHIHVLPGGIAPNTFQALTDVVYAEPAAFFSTILAGHETVVDRAIPFHQAWSKADADGAALPRKIIRAAGQGTLTEFGAMATVLPYIAQGTALHLANSMAVRYANILGIEAGIEVFANRGTSGIDGCNSTAVGAALAQPERPVVLLTGDVAFFYDRNAFWHNYPTPNLRVIVFNNHGGGIFRIIDGPRQQPELEEFFETRQLLTAENTARDFKLRYFPVSSFAELESALPVFFALETGAALLEVTTDSKTNAEFFEQYRAAVKAAFTN
ncbi:2-succinyl-5-enolpyruvyl-6-hydroxy-3-cyclohexene-1-carboxylic-acid synthase [Hymenobacter norwichensis]|uniref:2-succinyl-5-enolpyruvyl-6-hydroxy-3- cyclohexene-1-carboxylic-acid synthase n=1 Tax=Hymenobacter norwichensis TaxID=223903 RepID=UPI0003B6F6A1|nr:2-succinyl-5-enolpyruvyl-6-hydroxy-3-cyclohexene-1-carboxylic-acid synthase [Hymenobacter norwichensis]